MKNKKRVILDDYYYKFKVIIKNPKFIKRIKELHDLFDKYGCGIPKEGFSDWKETREWRERLAAKYSTIVRRESYQNERNKITGLKKTLTQEEFSKLKKWEKENTPPINWMENVIEILDEFRLDPKNKTNQEIVRNFILYRVYKDPRYISKMRLTRNEKTGELELWVRIYPYTQKGDIKWKEIEKIKKMLPGYVGKTKKKDNFDRDLEIYFLYRELLSETKGDEKKAFQELAGKTNKFVYVDRLSEIEEKYGFEELNEENLRKIIKYLHRLLGSVDL